MSTPLVSIITPVYNAEKFLNETIQSILSQTYSNWELLLVDDCSTDDSFRIIEDASKQDQRIHSFKNIKNSGTAFARNVGLENAKGDLICFLDADDCYDPEFLRKQIDYMVLTKSDFVFCSFRRLAENSVTDYIVPKKTTHKRILFGSCLTPLSVMMARKSIGELKFKEDCYVEDFVFFYEFMKKNGPAFGNKEVLASYRISSNSKSNNKKKLIKKMWETYHKTMHFNVIFSFIFLCCWAIHGYFKYRKVK